MSPISILFSKLAIILSPRGILLHAVMPPTAEHVYAQWCGGDEEWDQDGSNGLLAVNMADVSNLTTPLTHNINSTFNPKIHRAAAGLKSKGTFAYFFVSQIYETETSARYLFRQMTRCGFRS